MQIKLNCDLKMKVSEFEKAKEVKSTLKSFNPLENINPKRRLIRNGVLAIEGKTLLYKTKLGKMEMLFSSKDETDISKLNAFLEMCKTLGKFDIVSINLNNMTELRLSIKL